MADITGSTIPTYSQQFIQQPTTSGQPTPTVDLIQSNITPQNVISVSREGNNFYVTTSDGQYIKLNSADPGSAFKRLGINANFVQPGQTVSLAQAQTGQSFNPFSVAAMGTQTTTPLTSSAMGGVQAPSAGFEQTYNKPGIFSPGEGYTTTPTTRTFGKIGLDIYETTGGMFKHIEEKDLASTGLNKNPGWFETIPTIDVNQLTPEQKAIANKVSIDTWGHPLTTTATPTIDTTIPSTREISRGITTVPENVGTAAGFNQRIDDIIGSVYYNPQINYKDNQAAQARDFYKVKVPVTADNPGGYDIYDSNGNKIDLATFKSLGLNADWIPEKTTPSPLPQLVYNGEDSELQKKANKLQEQIDALTAKDPFVGKTIEQIRAELTSELGLDKLYADRNTIQKRIDAIYNAYDKLIGENDENPDITQTIKNKRLQLLSNKQTSQVAALTRQLDSINNAIAKAEATVTTRLSDQITQYNIYRNQLNDLQNAYDKLQERIDKEADNARQALQFLASNPEMLKDITQAEFDYINKNGTYPASLISKISKISGTKYQTIFHDIDANGVMHTYGVTSDGRQIEIGTVPGYAEPGGSDSNVVYTWYTNPITGEVSLISATKPTGPGTYPVEGSKLPTPASIKTAFINFANQYGGGYTESQYREIAIKNNLDVNDADIKKAISKGDKYDWNLFGNRITADPNDMTTPIVNFNSYLQSIGTTGSGSVAGTRLYKIIGSDGSTTRMLNESQVQVLKNNNYTVIPQ